MHLVVIGIGGSYLGARAAIDALSHTFHNQMDGNTQIYFAGQNISSKYITQLLELLEGKDFSINVISKSGTTTEPAVAFRIFRDYMEKKYRKEEMKERIYVTTDKEKGALKQLADEEGYETFVIPDDVGGRFSVLTAVGLLPIATAGLDIDKMMEGQRLQLRNTITQNFRQMKVINMLQLEMLFIVKENQSSYWSIMSHLFIMCLNGGNNYLEKVKEKTKKAYSLLLLIFQLTCIRWDNMYKKVDVT